jgi:uncharacterized zinc-type alcohol dehydrogenase-like protein
VTAVSRSQAKEKFALDSGAHVFVASESAEGMAAAAGSLDLILNTIPARHDWNVYQRLLARGGRQVILGAHAGMGAAMYAEKMRGASSPVIPSMIGGIANTQEVMDLCAREGIYPEIEIKPVQSLGEIYSALDAATDTGKRYVLDLAGTLTEEAFGTCDAPPPRLRPNQTGLRYGPVVCELFRMLFV